MSLDHADDGTPGSRSEPHCSGKTPIADRHGERLSSTRSSLTGADTGNGVSTGDLVRRAAKRKTLYVITC